VIHVFYPELLDEILDRLTAIPVTFDLLLTNASSSPVHVDAGRLPRAANVVVLDVDNRGRDLWPLAQLVNAGLLDPYHLILKLHTKRSAWRDKFRRLEGTGGEWRSQLLDALVGSPVNVTAILDAYATSPSLGIVTADGSVLGPDFWGGDELAAETLLRRLELELNPADLVFAAGSMYWIRGFVLQGLRALGLAESDFEDEAGQVDATTAHALERVIGLLAGEAGLSVVERSDIPTEPSRGGSWRRFEPAFELRPRLRVVPFYLPQFHPIPENNRWWGEGFTEWTNVVRARPMFIGHHQPKLPTVTGFYDLRLEETVALQTALAEEAGVTGFMYYHYWFAGHQLLEGPIESRLRDALPLPFCLMWANENWTRRWDGREDDMLIGQHYDQTPATRFIEDVMPVLRDQRYLRVRGRALIAVYRPGQIPNLRATIAAWRESAFANGVGELLVLGVDVAKEFHGLQGNLSASGLDGRLGFPPHNARWKWQPKRPLRISAEFAGNILSYRHLVEDAIRRLSRRIPDDDFPGVMVAFDNTARRQFQPDVWFGSNPYTFRRWLAAAATAVAHREPENRLVFVNAWNEWAEGAVLEPNDRSGPAFLLAVRDVSLS
jgi:lipopolysaccharide biosynthesis protein